MWHLTWQCRPQGSEAIWGRSVKCLGSAAGVSFPSPPLPPAPTFLLLFAIALARLSCLPRLAKWNGNDCYALVVLRDRSIERGFHAILFINLPKSYSCKVSSIFHSLCCEKSGLFNQYWMTLKQAELFSVHYFLFAAGCDRRPHLPQQLCDSSSINLHVIYFL